MNVLRIRMFGGMCLSWDQSEASITLPPSAQSLLAYLLLHRTRNLNRDALADLFWSESAPEQARRCLSTALWRLRCQLEPDGIVRGTFLVTTEGGDIGFNRDSDHWLDTAIFEDIVSSAIVQPASALHDQVDRLEFALSLYTGDLLEGWYMDWAIMERERLRLLYLNGLKHLMRYHQLAGNFEAGIACAQDILQHDPLREEIHRALMRMYAANGQRALAVRQYQNCREVLAQELDIPPMAETQMLYDQIRSTDTDRSSSPRMSRGHAMEEALTNLELAQRQLAEAGQRLEQALEIFRSLQATDTTTHGPERTPARNGLR